MARALPAYFISHGGGPWPWIDRMRAQFAMLETSLAAMPADIGKTPKAVLVISGHWEAEAFRVMASPAPPMVYDYYNFPPHTYDVVYPAPGAPEIARRTADLIAAAGLPTALDDTRGFDHGTFVPLYIMYPKADVPVFQVSMMSSYDPAAHVALGRAIAPLRQEGVLIVGSGLSYHNLSMFGPEAAKPSAALDAWLQEVLMRPPADRTAALLDWESAPFARVCHAREDHLVPLFAALGAAEGEVATLTYHEEGVLGGVTASSWRFG